MADAKFKNAAAKLLAQHSVKPGGKLTYGPPSGRVEAPATLEAPAARESKSAPPIKSPQPQPVPPPSRPVVEPRPVQADMITALIKYIIVIIFALLGCAIVILTGFNTGFGVAANIGAGLLGGAVLGMLIARNF